MTRSGRPAKIGMRPRNARSTSVFSRAMAPELYLRRPRRSKSGRARPGGQAFAREAFGDLGVGVVGVDGQAARASSSASRARPEREQGERAVACGRAADRCRRRPRRRSRDRAGAGRRRRAPCAASAQATPSRQPGRRARRSIGGEARAGRRCVSAKKSPSRRCHSQSVTGDPAGARSRGPRGSTPVARVKANVTGSSARATSAANSGGARRTPGRRRRDRPAPSAPDRRTRRAG